MTGQGDEWYYMDDKDVVHGPHQGEQMLAWLMNGYFDINLRVRQCDASEFLPLIHMTQLRGKVPFAEESQDRNGLRASPPNDNATLSALQQAAAQGPAPPGSGMGGGPPLLGFATVAVPDDGVMHINPAQFPPLAANAAISRGLNPRSAGHPAASPTPRRVPFGSGPASPSPAGGGSDGGYCDAGSEESAGESSFGFPGAAYVPALLAARPPPTHPAAGATEVQVAQFQRHFHEYANFIQEEMNKVQAALAAKPRKTDVWTCTREDGVRPELVDAAANTAETRGVGEAAPVATQTTPVLLPLSALNRLFADFGLQVVDDGL